MRIYCVFVILAVICLLYGLLVMAAGSGTGFFLVWVLISAFLGLCGFAARKQLLSGIPAAVKIAAAALFLILLFFFAFIQARIISGFSAEPEQGADYMIILGAQVRKGGPSMVLQYRLDSAADYLKKNTETVCIVSGGQGHNEPFPEAEGMRDYLVRAGICEDRILVEDRSRNTDENIEFSKQFLDPAKDSVCIVTNNFHVYRALFLSEKHGYARVSCLPAASSPLYLPNNMLRETLGVMKDVYLKASR